jgi:hypothetical protein
VGELYFVVVKSHIKIISAISWREQFTFNEMMMIYAFS